jgi:type II secretory pathway pseudopilin PulG
MNSHPTFATQSRARGFGLFETILTLSVMAILSGLVWTVFGPASASTSVAQESHRLGQLQAAVNNAYKSNIDFAGISTARSINEGWAPKGSNPNSDAWDGPFGLVPATVNVANDSWQAVEQSVPDDACLKLVGHETGKWTDIQVDGQSVTPDDALASCGVDKEGGHTLSFIQFGGVRHGSQVIPACYNTNPSSLPASPCLS